MSYIIQRDDGAYVARQGSEHSYTRKLQLARIFATRAAAERDCCGNERVLSVDAAIASAESEVGR